MSRAVVAFAGRGSYGPSSLGSLPFDHGWVRRADALRAAYDLPPLSELDAADRFTPSVHLRCANAAPLAFVCGLLDAERIAGAHEVVAVLACSTGWVTALAASGALGFDDAFRLVQEMGLLAEQPIGRGSAGGQLIDLLADGDWSLDPSRPDEIDAALDATGGEAHRAVELGWASILGGTEDGLAAVSAALPTTMRAGRPSPFRLAMHEAWHTPLRLPWAMKLRERLPALDWQRPHVTLIDGRGARWTPWSTDPSALADYTLADHVTTTYDFAAALRVALREYAPEVMLLPGPGRMLALPSAHLMVAEGYRGLRSRAEFEAHQADVAPLVLSMRR